MDRAYRTNVGMRNSYGILVGKPEAERPLEDQDVGR
jgi:hypothetical protein